MFLWFVGTVVVAVWFVFTDPRFDYRLLVVGSVLPLVDLAFGGARVLHSVTFCMALLTGLMLATAGRKPIRKTLLGLPVGILLHLVFTGAWRDADVFWWPFLGWSFDDAPHPVTARGWWNVPFELVGLGLVVWIVRSAELQRSDRFESFRRTGRLHLPVR
ncbi:MAG: hypothetical protein HKN41_04375 [Ilumatobacter sp.]|nr:hypothetical protein [Ilumatobacter sp.]